MEWINLYSVMPWIGRSDIRFIDSSAEELLSSKLKEIGFKIYIIDGLKIFSEKDFFDQISKVLEFPDYFGKNWDAFNDCIGDFEADGASKYCIIWRNASDTAKNNLYALVRPLVELVNLQDAYRRDTEDEGPEQFEVFFLGTGDSFVNTP